MECIKCKTKKGIKQIATGVTIYNGNNWLIEHADMQLPGWFILVLKRHEEYFYNLSVEDWDELYEFEYNVINYMNKNLGIPDEYTCCLAETDAFNHIHFHIVPRHESFDEIYKGVNAFQYLKDCSGRYINSEKILDFCDSAYNYFKNNWQKIKN